MRGRMALAHSAIKTLFNDKIEEAAEFVDKEEFNESQSPFLSIEKCQLKQ